MEHSTFDKIARGIGKQADRRSALKAFAASITAIGLGRAIPAIAAPEVQARCLGLNGECLGGRSNCCQGLRCAKKTGTCEWLKDHGTQEGDWCAARGECSANAGLRCDKVKNECVPSCIEPMLRCTNDDNCCGPAKCELANGGRHQVCCGVYGQTCETSNDCCVGYTCRNGYCRD